MEKGLKAIDVMFGVIAHLAVVFATVVGARGILIAVMSYRNPAYMRELPGVLMMFVAVVVIRVLSGLIEVACSRYLEERNNAAVCIVFSVIMTAFIAYNYPVAGIISAIAYVTIGGMIPLSNTMNLEKIKENYEEIKDEGNKFIGDVALGIDEVLQYGRGEDTIANISLKAGEASEQKSDIIEHEKNKHMLLALARSVFSVIVVFLLLFLYSHNKMSFEKVMVVSAAAIFSYRECDL